MLDWFMDLDPLVQVGALAVAGGLVMVAGVLAVERGFRREWELPAEPESWAARMATGERPLVRIEDQGHRTLVEDWRDQLGPGDAAPPFPRTWRPAPTLSPPKVGKHRHEWVGEETRPITLEEVARARREEGEGDHAWPA